MKFEDLFSSVNKIKGVGPVISKKLSDKGIENKIDLFLNLPTGAIDRRFCPKLDQLEIGVISTIFVRPIKYSIPRFRNLPNKVTCRDEFGSIDIIFFNSRESYIKQILPLNEEVVISGKVGFYKNKYQMTNPDYIQSIDKEKDITKIMAKYSSVAGISPKTIQKIYKEEIFGPVLSMMTTDTYEEALKLVNDHELGNGAAVFTKSGMIAKHFTENAKIGMIGVNVPIPVPVAYHSFGGWKRSLFGDHSMHGPEGVRFYTKLKTATVTWSEDNSGPEFTIPVLS